MELYINNTVYDSIVDGPGLRFAIFVQGCPWHCEGCHNPQTHPFDGGEWVENNDLIAQAKKNPLHSGITITGGEPLSQEKRVAELAQLAQQEGLNVWLYTGDIWERIVRDPILKTELLSYVDVLVDGPFEKDKQSYELKFRGSSNQRLIDVKKSLESGCVELWGE